MEVNVELGMQYLNRASNTSDPDCPQASYVFGLIQLGEIQGIAPPDTSLPETSGIAAMERAAWLGFAPAMLRMGMAWQGGEKGYDSVIALRYFHITSRQQQYLRYKGDTNSGLDGSAEVEISKWMLCGSEGIFEPNEEYAFYFAKLASEFGNGIAEFAVGYFYEVGIFVKQDIQAALIWYGIAASHDSTDAIDRLKELNLNRQNTITKKQHKRALNLKGRGSMKHFRRKADDSPAVKGSPYPEPEHPDVLRCSSRNSEVAPLRSETPSMHPYRELPLRAKEGGRASRVVSESYGPRPNPSASPNDAYRDGTERISQRSRKNRHSLPAEAYSTGTVTRLTPPHQQQQHPQGARKFSSQSPTRPQYPRDRIKDRRTSSPVLPSDSQGASFPGSSALPPMTSISLASRRPLPVPVESTENGTASTPTKKLPTVSLDNSPTPALSPISNRGTPERPSSFYDHGAPADPNAEPEVKEAELPTNAKRVSRFSVMGMFFGYGKDEEKKEEEKKEEESSKAAESDKPNSTSPSPVFENTTPRRAESMNTDANKSPSLRSNPSPQPQSTSSSRSQSPTKWNNATGPRATTMPIQQSSASKAMTPSPSRMMSTAHADRSQSPRKYQSIAEPSFMRHQSAQHTLDMPPSMGATRTKSPRTPPRGSPSPSRYSPSRASTINSTSTSTSAESATTPASSLYSRSGSSSPVRRSGASYTSKVPVIPATIRSTDTFVPKTFEEMGIPIQSKAKGDCVIM